MCIKIHTNDSALVLNAARVTIMGLVLSLLQGVKAAAKEAETKLLEARLQASEQSAELIRSLSSPQVCFCRTCVCNCDIIIFAGLN